MSAHRTIVHLDLNQGLTSLDGGLGGVFVVFWWRDVPLGHFELDAEALPVSGFELAGHALRAIGPALDAYLGQRPRRGNSDAPSLLQAALSMLENVPGLHATAKGEGLATVSVIVPTRDRPGQLAACLESLAGLRDQPLEIVVVDNAPAGDAASATRQVVEAHHGVRYVAESRPGSSAARNAGVAASRGELVAFVDDDETVHPDWLGRLVAGFRDRDVAVVTGLVLPAELETEAQWIFEQRYGFGRGYVARTLDTERHRDRRHRDLPAWDLGGSGNMAMRRDVFDQLGGFDERLGAGRAGGCEELELFYRTLVAGWSGRYEPRAVTHHTHRRDMASLKQQLRAYMRGHVAAALMQWAGRRDDGSRDSGNRDFGNLRHLLWTLPRAYAGYSLRCLLGDPAYRASHLATEIAGGLAGVDYYRRHRRLSARPQSAPPMCAERVTIEGAGPVAATNGGQA